MAVLFLVYFRTLDFHDCTNMPITCPALFCHVAAVSVTRGPMSLGTILTGIQALSGRSKGSSPHNAKETGLRIQGLCCLSIGE